MKNAWANRGRRVLLFGVLLSVTTLIYLAELNQADWEGAGLKPGPETGIDLSEAEERAFALEAMAFASIGDFPPGTPLSWDEARALGALLPEWIPDTVKADEIRVLALPEGRFFTEFGRQFFLGQEPYSFARSHRPDASRKGNVLRQERVDINGSRGVALFLKGGYIRLSWVITDASMVLFGDEERISFDTLRKVACSIHPKNPR